MSVALIAHYLGPKLGIGQYLDQLVPPLIKELKNLGVKVKIFTSPNALQNTPSLQNLKDTVSLPPLDYSPGKRYAWFATRFSSYCQREGVKAVVWLSNPIVLPWHPLTISVLHDVNEWKAETKYGTRLKTALRAFIYLDASIRFSKKIIAVSKATEKDLLHFRPNSKLRLKLKAIPNGSDSQLVNLPSVAISAPTNPFLLSVGRIDPSAKCLPEAVTLVSAIREISGEPWELHIVGGMNTSTQSAGEVFLKSVETLPWVNYHGHVDDSSLAEWYRRSTAVIFLSANEGFGLPIAEAASFGRWVVVNKNNQAGIEAGVDAIIPIDPNQPYDACAKFLLQLIERKSPTVNSSLPLWQSTATAYSEVIRTMIHV